MTRLSVSDQDRDLFAPGGVMNIKWGVDKVRIVVCRDVCRHSSWHVATTLPVFTLLCHKAVQPGSYCSAQGMIS